MEPGSERAPGKAASGWTLATAVAVALGFSLFLTSASTATASPPNKRGFQQCDNVSPPFHVLRVDGVSCSKGKKVANRWYDRAVDEGGPRVVKFKQWRCVRSDSHYDFSEYKCKRGSDQVRFAFGGKRKDLAAIH